MLQKLESSEIPSGKDIREEEEGAIRKSCETRPGDRVWSDVVQAEERSTSVGHSDVLGLSAFQSGRAE